VLQCLLGELVSLDVPITYASLLILCQGHAKTVEKVLKWLDEEGGVSGVTVCDAGCGTGMTD
jgi:ribosomal protein L11 methylase PrmA